MTPAVAPHPSRRNPSSPQPPAAAANPNPGFGPAPADNPAPRRAPRLAKRRHAATSSRSRPPPSPAAAWNPFGGGGTDGARHDGVAVLGSADGGFGTGKDQSGGFVFGAAPAAADQQPPRQHRASSSSDEAPFLFGSVRDSLPRFEEGWSASSSKLPDKMERMNLQSSGEGGANASKDQSSIFGVDIPGLVSNSEVNVLPEKLTQLNIGREAPLQSADGAPEAFVFGGNGAGSTAAPGVDSYVSNSFSRTEANDMPEKPTQFSVGNQAPSGTMGSGASNGAPTSFVFGRGTASGRADCVNDVASSGGNPHNPSGAVNGTDDASLLPEKITRLIIGSSVPLQQMESGSVSHEAQAFSFGSGRTEGSVFGMPTSNTSDKSISMDGGGSFVSGAKTNCCSSVHGSLPEKMTKLNIGRGVPSQTKKDQNATQPPQVFVFGSTTTTDFSSAQAATTSFTSMQTNVSFEPKDNEGNPADDDIRNSTYSGANNDRSYGPGNFVFSSSSNAPTQSEGSAGHALHDEINKLNIRSEGTSIQCTKVNNSSAPETSSKSKAEATSVYGAASQPNVQEPFLFTPLNHSYSFSTPENAMPSFSSGTNAGREAVPNESCAVKQDPSWCSRESLFGMDYIKSAYRDKKEAHKTAKKNRRPTKLKQRAQLHQSVSHETRTNGLGTDTAGDYSPMDCSPYPARDEQVSREASVTSDQSIHFCENDAPNQIPSGAEHLVSATEHLVIDADLPTLRDEGRVLNADASANSFGSSFSSFDEEVNLCNASQPSLTSMNAVANGEPKTVTTDTCRELGEHATSQSSSENFIGLNFSFGAALSPQSSLSVQKRNTRRKLRTKGAQVLKTSAAQASVQPKASQVKEGTQFAGANKTEDSVKEQSARDASISAALETCETWRTSGNQAYANGHFATAEEYYTRGINSISQYVTSGRCSHSLMLCYSNRAATRMSLGRMREALQDCLFATSIDPTFVKAKVRAANCQLALGDLEDASRSYTACLKSRTTACSDFKMFSEASDGLERVKRVSTWISQSKELLKKRTMPEATMALEMISNALRISSHSDNLMEMKAEALLALRKYEEVIQLCQETIDLAERNSVLPNTNGEPMNSSVAEKTECSGRLWRRYLVCKTYFLLGKLEDALDLLNKHQQVTLIKESDGSTSRDLFSSLSTTIRQLISLKAAGNESFQARRYSEAVEQYSAALACNSDSRPFSAVCFCNRAAAYQALGQVTDAIADCSLAMVLDANYPKAISRRATLYEMIRDYGQASNDLRKLISLIEKHANKPGVSPKVFNKHSDLKQARARLIYVEDEARKDTPLNLYLILGVEPSCSPADIKKAYRKAALRHHPDKAAQLLVRNENADDGFWREVAKEVYAEADHLFKTIGEAYNVLSDSDKRQEYDLEENLRNATKSAFKGRNMHRSPEQSYSKRNDRGFNPRQWQNRSGGSRSRWSGYSDEYW